MIRGDELRLECAVTWTSPARRAVYRFLARAVTVTLTVPSIACGRNSEPGECGVRRLRGKNELFRKIFSANA